MGLSTLIDVITITDRLNQVRIRAIREQSELAQLIVRLRHETGSLILKSHNKTKNLTLPQVTTLPWTAIDVNNSGTHKGK